MTIYVSELPKSCLECPCCNQDFLSGKYFCSLGCEINNTATKKLGNCPLQSLFDYTKQVRMEVVEEIKEKLKPKEIFHPEDEFEIDYDFYYKEDVDEILDQIQGE